MNQQRLYQVIFESDTRAGRNFDLALMGAIVASLVVVILESMNYESEAGNRLLSIGEWFFTLLFSVEYLARLYCAPQRLRYATSFFGVIDLLSILPAYLALLFPELHALLDVRALRLLRVFRVLKLTQYLTEVRFLAAAVTGPGLAPARQ